MFISTPQFNNTRSSPLSIGNFEKTREYFLREKKLKKQTKQIVIESCFKSDFLANKDART
jgi:hypothetical protein